MSDYVVPTWQTIDNKKKRLLSELFSSSLINAFTEEDYLCAITIFNRVVDRVEKEGKETD